MFFFFFASVLAQGKKKRAMLPTVSVQLCFDTLHVTIRFISPCGQASMTRLRVSVNMSRFSVLVHSVIIFVSSSFWWPLQESLQRDG